MQNYEADVVIVGYGGAGAAAALTAHHAGASVLIIEKNAEGGGNTRYSGGSMRTYADPDKAADYFETLCEGATERDVIETFVSESTKNPEWVASLGAQVVPTSNRARKFFPLSLPRAAFPSIRGAEGIGPRMTVKGTGDHAGVDLWGLLARKVSETPIQVLNSAAAKQLLTQKGHGVTGVVAEVSGEPVTVKARRAVIMTCGGFEYDTTMHLNYLGQKYFGLCNPANTGDGIRMAGEIGADLWHMNAAAVALGIKLPEFPCGMRQSVPHEGYIYVDQFVGSSRVDLQACKLEYSIVSPK